MNNNNIVQEFFKRLFSSFFKRFGNLKRHTTEQVDLSLDEQLDLPHANMFDGLRKAFSIAIKSIGQRDLSEKDLDNSLRDLQYLALLTFSDKYLSMRSMLVESMGQ